MILKNIFGFLRLSMHCQTHYKDAKAVAMDMNFHFLDFRIVWGRQMTFILHVIFMP